MSFNSLDYIIFCAVVFTLFNFTREKWRWIVLLAASYCFYGALREPLLIVVLLLVILITYLCGAMLDKCQDAFRRNAIFWGGVAGNLLILVSLKYVTFVIANLNSFFELASLKIRFPAFSMFASIGVSYYVFQAISYLIDIYLETAKPEKHLGYFALYLSFFPKLMQGPLERAGDLLPQLRSAYAFNYDNMRIGLLQFGWGLYKKVVVADRLALFVNPVYDDVHSYTGVPLIMATYLYALQLYCDFSGYTDMALGTARIFNITLTRNFNSPYFATSVAEFWRRWHISFSRWLLDYLFKPLQMHFRDKRNAGTALALLITFTICGIWHGASWTYIAWGALHGIYLASSIFYKPLQKRIYKNIGLEKSRLQKIWQTLATFHLVCFAWIFFRANSLGDSAYVITHLFSGVGETLRNINAKGVFRHDFQLGQKGDQLAIILVSLCVMLYVSFLKNRKDLQQALFDRPAWFRWPVYYALALSVLFLGVSGANRFIYFQF
jgi:D-alanyl-lipoteichoic acid acyltransferase DltB (MBOAT superfamily)